MKKNALLTGNLIKDHELTHLTRIMRTIFFLIFVVVFQMLATEADAQKAKVNISKNELSLRELITEIEKQTDYLFVYEDSEVDVSKSVKVNARNKPVTDILKQVFGDGSVVYEYANNYISLRRLSEEEQLAVQQQVKRQISGKVVDENGVPIIGANVIEKGTTNGVITDLEGDFMLQVNENALLQVSYIGYISQEMSVRNRQTFMISLQEDFQALDEVVVVGYGTQRKVTLSGSVAAIKGGELTKSPAVNITNSLAGRLPGLTITSRSGEPGREDIGIFVRGRGTTNDNSALIIIDGVERGGLGELNPNDIESISVLKDASAAIYGSRGANGVILITTKRGSSGKPTINFSYNQGFSQPTRNPKMADSYTFAKVANEIEIGEGRNARYTDEELMKYKDGSDPNYPNMDWYDYMVKTLTPQHRTNLSITGGNDRVSYYVSFGELFQSGQYKNGSREYRQYNLRSNIDVKVTEDLKVGMNLAGRYDDKHYPYWSAFELNSHIYLYQPNWLPTWPGTDYRVPNRDAESILNWVGDDAGSIDERVVSAQSTLYFKWDIPYVKGLTIDGSGSFDPGIPIKDVGNGNSYTKDFQTPTYVYYKDDETGELKKGLSGKAPALSKLEDRTFYSSQLYLTAKINYERAFGNHNIGAMLGYEQTQIKWNEMKAGRSDFLSTSIPELNVGSNDKNKQWNSGRSGKDARQNYFGRISYDYAGKYIGQFTMRADGSPKFPKDKRFGYFPSASLAWRISEEAFMKEFDFLNNLKIRGSFGKMGNDRVNSFQYMVTYGFDRNYVIGNNDVSGLVQTNEPNPVITWETAKTWNAGLDATLWNGLLSLEFDYFTSRRSDILTKRNAIIPEYTGLSLPDENIGIVDNKGFELVLTHQNKVNDFQYSLSGNVSFARNKVVFSDEQPAAEPYQYATGRPYGSMLLYHSIGIFKDQEQIDQMPHLPGARPGDIIYEDVNKDGEINSLDMIRINQNNVPEMTFGLTANFAYKGFDLSLLFQGQENSKQHWSSWFPMMSTSFGNFLAWRAEDRWSPENTNATMPRGSFEVVNNNTSYPSTHWMFKTGFLRLKNVELGYNLPPAICEKFKVIGLRLSLSGSNLFFVYDHMKKLGFDPETKDFWYYPQQRVYNIGVNVTF